MTAFFTSKADFYEGSPVLGGGGGPIDPPPGGGTPSTGSSAGSPGTFSPAGSDPPADFAALSSHTADPTTAWTEGQYVVLGDGSEAYWDGTAWKVGRAPAPTTPQSDPQITAVAPATAVANSGTVSVTVTGTDFVNGSTVEVNQQAAQTTYASATQLTAMFLVPATAGNATVTVRNPDGGESADFTFTVTDAPPPPPAESNPQISSLSPIGATTTDPTPITITVTGTEFVNGSTVEVNQQAQQTTYVSATELTALFAPSAAGSYTFTVRNPDGGESGDVIFTVT